MPSNIQYILIILYFRYQRPRHPGEGGDSWYRHWYWPAALHCFTWGWIRVPWPRLRYCILLRIIITQTQVSQWVWTLRRGTCLQIISGWVHYNHSFTNFLCKCNKRTLVKKIKKMFNPHPLRYQIDSSWIPADVSVYNQYLLLHLLQHLHLC